MTASNNSENAEVTLKHLTKTVKAPAKIEFPAKTYHKIKDLTDIAFINDVE
jgi:hypothetical protein